MPTSRRLPSSQISGDLLARATIFLAEVSVVLGRGPTFLPRMFLAGVAWERLLQHDEGVDVYTLAG